MILCNRLFVLIIETEICSIVFNHTFLITKINIDLHRDFIFIFVISFQFHRLSFILLYRLFRNILWVYILNFKDFLMNDHFCNIFQYIFHLLNRYVLRFIICDCCAIIIFILKKWTIAIKFFYFMNHLFVYFSYFKLIN